MPDVFDAEGAVEPAAVDVGVAETGPASRKGMLASEAGLDQAVDEGVGGPGGAAVVFGELSPDEDAGMEADEGEPGGLVGRKAEGAERGVSTAQVGNVGRRGRHVRSRAGDSPLLRASGAVRVVKSRYVWPPSGKQNGPGGESSWESKGDYHPKSHAADALVS